MTSQAHARLAQAALRLIEANATALPSVSRVAEEAGVSRRTFYRQYSSVEEALRSGLEADGAAFARSCAPERVRSGVAYLEAVFTYWEDKEALLAGLARLGLAQDCVMCWLRAAGAQLHRVDLAKLDDAEAARYLTDFMTGGVATVIIERAGGRKTRISPAQLAKIISLTLGNAGSLSR